MDLIKTEKRWEKSIETISYSKLINSSRFISSSLIHHVDKLSEIYNEKCSDKNCKCECEFKGV